jgi:hypothetical protein
MDKLFSSLCKTKSGSGKMNFNCRSNKFLSILAIATSSQRAPSDAPRELPESSQRAPRELPESSQRALSLQANYSSFELLVNTVC